MKNFYIIVLALLSPAFLFSQNFALLNQDTKSLYSVNETGKTFSLSIENMFTANGNTIYTTFHIPGDSLTANDCCNATSGTVVTDYGLIGDTIIKQTNETWLLFNHSNDSVYINPQLNLGEENMMATINGVKYILICTGVNQENFLQTSDLVKTFKIQAKDLNNNNISSLWNDKEIKVSQNNGLIAGCGIKFFPDSLQTFQIEGSVPMQQGLYLISSAMIYDFQPGDQFQYKKRDYLKRYPYPEQNHDSSWYEKHTILQRVDFPEKVTYKIQKRWFLVNSLIEYIDTVDVEYSKIDTISIIPIEYFPFKDMAPSTQTLLYKELFNDVSFWTYDTYEDYNLWYCSSSNTLIVCNEPPSIAYYQKKQNIGLGLCYYIYTIDWDNITEYRHEVITTTIVYFKKGNLIWNSPFFVGTEQPFSDQVALSLIPNPANDKIRINSHISGTLQIIDLNGQIVYSNMIKENSPEELSIAQYSKGIYLVRITNNKTAITKKFIKN